MRILYCPSRFPFKASNRLLGGERKSFKLAAKSNWSSFRLAIFHKLGGQALRAYFVSCHAFKLPIELRQ